MKALLIALPLLLLCACSGPFRGPNHFGVKPSYEIDTEKGYEPINRYKVETSLDWNW